MTRGNWKDGAMIAAGYGIAMIVSFGLWMAVILGGIWLAAMMGLLP